MTISDEILGTEIAWEQYSERRQEWRKATALVSTRRPQAIERKIAQIQARYGDLVRNFSSSDAQYHTMSF